MQKALFFLGIAPIGRLPQSEKDDLFTGDGADIVMHADDLDPGDLVDHGLHERPRRLDEMGPYLFEQVPALFRGEGLDQVLFGRCQDALEADHEEIPEQVGVHVLGTSAHVILLKAAHPLANSGFYFPLCLHAAPRQVRDLTQARLGGTLPRAAT